MKELINLLLALPPEFDRFSNIATRLQDFLPVALIIAVSMGFVYAVYLGVKLAMAEDQSKRMEAKKHIFTFIGAMVLVVLLLWLVPTLMNWASTLF